MSDRKGCTTVHFVALAADPMSYPLLDWLRFVLASVVVVHHAGMIQWPHAGNLAVQVFFALSGWLIGGILFRSDYRDLPRFFFNRATRIWIPYAAAIFAIYGLGALRDGITPRFWEFLFYDVTFTHNWFSLLPTADVALAQMPLRGTGNHFWSISVEEQFYLGAPLLMVALRFGKSPLFWAALSGGLLTKSPDFASIALGVLAANLKDRYGPWHVSAGSSAALIAASIACLGGMFHTPYYSICAPVFAVSVVLSLARFGRRSRVGVFFGGISYPVYLNHWIGVFAANAVTKYICTLPPLAWSAIAYAGGIAAGTMAYIAIDRNVLTRRDAFYSPCLGVALALMAYAAILLGWHYAAPIPHM